MKMSKSGAPWTEEVEAPCEARMRLLLAAEKLFAERGAVSVSVRDLAREAKVNVAAVNYYYGCKENLYLETLRYSFRNSREAFPKLEALLKEARAAGTVDAALRGVHLYIEEFMQIIFISGATSCRAALLGHEMSRPTKALDIIIEEFISPTFKMLVTLIEQARPDLAAAKEANLAAMSIIGQCLNYSLALPITLKLLKRSQMTPAFVKKLANQISEFSLKALSPGPPRTMENSPTT
jgi:AcrR family transcriptional regulator